MASSRNSVERSAVHAASAAFGAFEALLSSPPNRGALASVDFVLREQANLGEFG